MKQQKRDCIYGSPMERLRFSQIIARLSGEFCIEGMLQLFVMFLLANGTLSCLHGVALHYRTFRRNCGARQSSFNGAWY